MSDSEQPDNSSTERSRWVWSVPLALLGTLIAAWFLWPAFQEFLREGYQVLASGEEDRIRSWVAGYGAWGFVVIYALMLMQTLIPVLPSVVAMVAAVLAWGPLKGGIVAWTGMLIAAALGYGIGRLFGPLTVDRLLGSEARHKVERQVDRYGLWAIIVARISPVLSTDAVSIVAGLVKMRFWRFMLATAAGTLPLTVLIAVLGRDIDHMKTGLIWVSVISIVAFIAWVIYDRRYRRPAPAGESA